METYFLCIDSSLSSTGLSIMRVEDTEAPSFYLLSKNAIKVKQRKDKTKFDRKLEILELFNFYLDAHAGLITFALFEEYAYGGNGHLCDLAELAGLYKYSLSTRGIPFDTIAPKSVKKLVSGNGNATKELVAESIKKFIVNIDQHVFTTNDETDSIAIGIAYSMLMFRAEKENESKQNQEKD